MDSFSWDPCVVATSESENGFSTICVHQRSNMTLNLVANFYYLMIVSNKGIGVRATINNVLPHDYALKIVIASASIPL